MATKDPILNELRVDKDVPDQDGALGKLRIVYDGISANSWLRPFGLTLKRSNNLERPKTVELNEDVKNSIRERAQSANCILGRRHFELERQELSRDQVLIGRAFNRRADVSGGNHVTFSDEIDKPDGEKVNRRISCRSALSTCRPSTSSPGGEVKRPFTGIGNYRPYTAQCTRNGTTDLPDLSITQIIACKGDAKVCETKDRHTEVGVNDVRRTASVLDNEKIRFRTFSAMKQAYKARVFSAPPKYQNPVDSTPECDGRETSRTCAYESRQDRAQSSRGPMLKPLLYSQECDISHGTGCPYKCKGCFRACLASDEYFENARNKSNLFSPRRQSSHPARRKVSYRLRPALRMAFLEQLSIEERAKHLGQEGRSGAEGEAARAVEKEVEDKDKGE